MDYIFVGKLVNTHGIKGEVRIISNFEYKDKIFKKNFSLYLGLSKEKVTITTYRVHKNYDMVTFDGFKIINDVLRFKGLDVFVLKSDIKLCEGEVLADDLLYMKCYYNNELIGEVKDVVNNNGYKLFDIGGIFIPYNKEFIATIDLKNKKIIFKNIGGLL